MPSNNKPDVPAPYGPLGSTISNASLNGIRLDPKDLTVAVDNLSMATTLSDMATKAYVDANSPYEVWHAKAGQDTMKVKGNLVIESASGEEVDVGNFIEAMKDRMLILQPNFEAMEEYPALKDAYYQYKMLEKLLMDNAKKD